MNRTSALALAALLSAGCTFTLDPDQYAPASCGANEKACGYKCVRLDDPATGCGSASCEPCGSWGNATVVCGQVGTPSAGQCTIGPCDLGWGDCINGPSDGCETRLNDPINNCGACNRPCDAGVACNSAGYCEPASVSVGASPTAICGLAADPVDTSAVYYAATTGPGVGEIGRVRFLGAGTTSTSVVWPGLGQITSLAGNAARLFFGVGSPSPSVYRIEPVADGSIPVQAWQRLTTGDGDLVAASNDGGWWVPPGGSELWRLLPTLAIAFPSPVGVPVGRWRALATHPVTGDAFVADDAPGGRILRVPNGISSSELGLFEELVTGAGEVGALAVRSDGAAGWEVYWGDLATGDVKRLLPGGSPTTLHRGAGRTSRMRMVADNWGVYWLDADNREVMEFLAGSGAIISLRLGGSAVDIAAGTSSVFWTEGTRQLFAARR